jgi:hypothetical protein
MQDEVKITVIATGFGVKQGRHEQAYASSAAEYTVREPAPLPAAPKPEFGTDDEDINIPAFLRHRV